MNAILRSKVKCTYPMGNKWEKMHLKMHKDIHYGAYIHYLEHK